MKNGSRFSRRSWTFCTPRSPATELTTPWYSSGFLSLTRNDSCIWSTVSESGSGCPRTPSELLVRLLLGLEVDAAGGDLGVAPRVCWMASFCASVTSWPGSQLSPRVSAVHRKTEISILSYQPPFIRSTCWLASSPAPNSDSDTHIVMMTARVMVRFWRRPLGSRRRCGGNASTVLSGMAARRALTGSRRRRGSGRGRPHRRRARSRACASGRRSSSRGWPSRRWCRRG